MNSLAVHSTKLARLASTHTGVVALWLGGSVARWPPIECLNLDENDSVGRPVGDDKKFRLGTEKRKSCHENRRERADPQR